MGRSTPLQRAYDRAREFGKNLTAKTPLFNSNVLVIHDEGSVFAVASAFLVKFVDDEGTSWIAMFAEHQDMQVWAEEELLGYSQYGPQQEIQVVGPAD